MIRLVREIAIEKPWFFRVLMISIALAFVISMGWGLGQSSDELYVARVNETTISRIEYRRAYNNAYQFYRDMLKENFDEEHLGETVINGLIERHLWVETARDLNATASTAEVREAIKSNRNFFRKGRFDPEHYRFVLSQGRPPMSMEQYETSLRDELSVDKIKSLITDGLILTAAEKSEALLTVTNTELSPDKKDTAEERAVLNFLSLKKQRALMGYMESLKSNTPIEINEVLL